MPSTRLDALFGTASPDTATVPTPVPATRLDALFSKPQAASAPEEGILDSVKAEALKFGADLGAFGKFLTQNPKILADTMTGHPLRHAKFADEEEAESVLRGALNVVSLAVPYGGIGKAVAQPIGSALLRKAAAMEISNIAAVSTWMAGQAAIERENISKAALEGAGLGAVAGPAGLLAGKALGLGVKGAAKGTGAALRVGVGKPAKATADFLVKHDPTGIHKATQDFLSHSTDRVVWSGEQLLRKAGMGKIADSLKDDRTETHFLMGRWQALLETIGEGLQPSAFSGKSKANRRMRENWGRLLDAPDEEAAQLAANMPQGQDLLARRELLKRVHNEIADMAEQAGVLQVDQKTGKLRYFVRRQDWGMPRMYVNLEHMLRPGKLQDEAIARLKEQYPNLTDKRALRILGGLHKRQQAALDRGSWEGMGYMNLQGRRYNLPGYELDPFKVLPNYYSRMAREIVNARRYGKGNLDDAVEAELSKRVAQLQAQGQTVTPDDYVALADMVESELKFTPVGMAWGMEHRFPGAFQGLEEVADPARQKLAKAIISRQLGGVERDLSAEKVQKFSQAQAVMKLGLSQISQLSQFGQPFVQTGYRDGFRDLFRLAARDPETHVRLLRTGAFHESLARQAHMELMGGEASWVSNVLRKTGFTKADTAARKFGVLRGFSMAQHQAEELPRLLAERAEAKGLNARYVNHRIAQIEKKFLQLGIDPEKVVQQGGVLEEDDLLRAGQKISTDVNFWSDSLSLPEFYRSPWGRVVTQFKSFVYQQTSFLDKAVIKPALQGDLAPLARLLATQSVVGEGIADLRSLARMRERDKEGYARIVDNLAQAAAFGGVYDAFRATSFPGGAANWLGGPLAGDLYTGVEGVVEATQGRPKKLIKQAVRTAPVFMGPLAPIGAMSSQAINNLLFPPE